MDETLLSSIISGASGVFGAVVGGALTVWGAFKVLERSSRDLETTQVRLKKVECITTISGLRWVLGRSAGVADDFKGTLMFELNKISALWADDLAVLNSLRNFYRSQTNEHLVHLIRALALSAKLPFGELSDDDLTSIFTMPMRSG